MIWRRAFVIGVVLVVALSGPAVAFRGAPPFWAEQVYEGNFPDPHVIFDPSTGTYLAYGTNTGGATLPMMQSTDLETWTAKADLFTPPRWAASVAGETELWAPSIHQLPDGTWIAYTSIRETNAGQSRYCISAAVGLGPLGPFVDLSEEPLTCGYGAAGAIDPWLYVDTDGEPWLLWKTEDHRRVDVADDDVHFPLLPEEIEERVALAEEGDPPELRTLASAPDAIWSQRLDSSGLEFYQPEDDEEPRSTAAILLTAKSGWEGKLIESPSMFRFDGQLHLLYSANRWESHEYATGWATCSGPEGPCQRRFAGPLLAHGDGRNGPGGASVFVDAAGDHRIAFHAWNAPYVSYPSYPSCDTDGDRICADEGQRLLEIELLCSLPSQALHVGKPTGWPFCDVDPSQWFGPGIAWMAQTEITTGITEARFAPERGLTRAEAVTFLWRWAGSPAAADPSPFTDVGSGRYYSTAVAWAASTGIIRGTTPTTFSPDSPIDRGQIATILHRAAGTPKASQPATFTDVPTARFFTDAVAWAAETGITTGATSTTFAPTRASTRAEFATMLCRFSRTPVMPESGVSAATESCTNA